MARARSTQEKRREVESVPASPPDPDAGLFGALGIYGMADLAPVLVAALATEEPLLLIGPHGTAKSLLLTRVAAALGLVSRHYNASLLNFDDLIGFPVPDREGKLQYLQTPATIWGAGAVIFDEISRCRPDIQNKLFPIIHERRAQGLPLEGLRYRWAAMNPPAGDGDDSPYLGSEPLDPALADRFGFVVAMPPWDLLREADQLAVIRAGDRPVDPDAARNLASAVALAGAAIPVVRLAVADALAEYVRTLLALLQQAGLAVSPRRAGMLFRGVIAVQAAAPSLPPGEAVLLALANSLPHRAQGIAIPEAKLVAAHREAWRLAGIAPGDPLRAILTAADPVERLRLAVAVPTLGRGEFSSITADVLARLPAGPRDAVVVHLFETGAAGRLTAAVAEQAGEIYAGIAVPTRFSEALHGGSPRFATWQRIRDLLSRLDPARPEAHLRANALASAFARNEIATPEAAEAAFDAFPQTLERLRGMAA